MHSKSEMKRTNIQPGFTVFDVDSAQVEDQFAEADRREMDEESMRFGELGSFIEWASVAQLAEAQRLIAEEIHRRTVNLRNREGGLV